MADKPIFDQAEPEGEEPKRKRKDERLAPTPEYLLALADELTQGYSEQDKQIDDARAVRELRSPIQLEDRLRLVAVDIHDPTATDEGQRTAASISLNPPKLHVTSAKEGSDTATENATKREHWTEASFAEEGGRADGVPTHHLLVDATVNDGAGWAKLIFSKDLWDKRYSISLSDYQDTDGRTDSKRYETDTEDAKKEAGSPFEWIAVDVRTVYPVWYGNRIGEVMEIQDRPCRTTFRQHRLGFDKNGEIVSEELGQPESKETGLWPKVIRQLEHWDDTWVSYYLVTPNGKGENKMFKLKQWKHGYKRHPYEFAPGIWMSHWKNRKVGWGVYQAKAYLIRYREFLWTVLAQLAARDTGSPLFRERSEIGTQVIGKDGKPRMKDPEPWKVGDIIEGEPGEKLYPIAFPQIAPALIQQLEVIDKAIEKMETPRLPAQLSGLEGAGFAMNTVIAEGNIRHGPIIRNLEKLYERATLFKWSLIREKVGETVWVRQEGEQSGWLSIKPEELTDVCGVRWEISPERPSAKLIEARYWHERLTAGTSHMDQAIEAMGDNPDEIRRGKARDRIRQKPEYIALMDQTVFEEAGRGDILQQAIEMAQTGVVPGAPGLSPMGGPGMPGDPAALSMSPNGAGASLAPTNTTLPGQAAGPSVPSAAGGAAMVQPLTQ